MATKGKIRKAEPLLRPGGTDSPLSRMKRAGMLSVHELTAADEIVAAYSMSIGEPVSRDSDLGILLDMRPDAADATAARRSDISVKFQEWLASLRGTMALQVALGVLVRGQALAGFDATQRWRKGTAKEHLLSAIRHFAALRGNTPRGARGWKIGAAVTSQH